MKHLYLIGYRGSGKSTVGRALAHKLSLQFVDTDLVVESNSKRSIREIFEHEGESGFRDREQEAIAWAASQESCCVIALGGGAILREANQTQILSTGFPIWLQGSAEHLYTRISHDATTGQRRPNLSSRGGYDEVVEILAIREPIYRQLAKKTVITDGRNPDELVAEIAAWVKTQPESIFADH